MEKAESLTQTSRAACIENSNISLPVAFGSCSHFHQKRHLWSGLPSQGSPVTGNTEK